MAGALRVVATAGHVDHGKSALLERLTGMDPDRLAEEKRRGLTIDLGYAWCVLPGGREVGFVDVPGHERFLRTMLAGVGPAPMVLVVVAADEGWAAQSEEHLAIIDLLDVAGAVIALTKRDLVDAGAAERRMDEVRERVRGTRLEGVPIVPVSATTGEGVDELAVELGRMAEGAEAAEDAHGEAEAAWFRRARLWIDRSFTIRGSGTVVTGTLAGGELRVGEEVAILPGDRLARIRGLQIHGRQVEEASAVARVAVNLAGLPREEVARGDVLVEPDDWRATSLVEVLVRAARSLDHEVSDLKSLALYAGSAEAGAALRLLEPRVLIPGGEAFARLRLARPLALEFGDRFVLRDPGRGEVIVGGTVLDVEPPRRAGAGAGERLAARAAVPRRELPTLLVRERGAVRRKDVRVLTGVEPSPPSGTSAGGWLLRDDLLPAAAAAVSAAVGAFHREHPEATGAPVSVGRDAIAGALREAGIPPESGLLDALLDIVTVPGPAADSDGPVPGAPPAVVRTDGGGLRLPSHRPEAVPGVDDLLDALRGADDGATPPSVRELTASGIDPATIEAAITAGEVVRLGPDLVVAAALVARGEGVVRGAPEGITVSRFREALGTTRRVALPLLERFDRQGVTRREGDLRFPRAAG